MELLGLAHDGILVPVVMLREVQLTGARRSEEWGAGTEVLIGTCCLSNSNQGAGGEEDEKSDGHREGWCWGLPRAALGWLNEDLTLGRSEAQLVKNQGLKESLYVEARKVANLFDRPCKDTGHSGAS